MTADNTRTGPTRPAKSTHNGPSKEKKTTVARPVNMHVDV